MLVYLVENDYEDIDKHIPSKVFTDKSMAEEYFHYLNSIYGNRVFKPTTRKIELITDEFMEFTLQQPKPPKEFT
jgi:hypothetical protein